jgi:hypothetical protein
MTVTTDKMITAGFISILAAGGVNGVFRDIDQSTASHETLRRY